MESTSASMESTSANIRRTYVDVGKPNGTHAKESLSQVATVPKGVERLNMAGRTRRKSAFCPHRLRKWIPKPLIVLWLLLKQHETPGPENPGIKGSGLIPHDSR
jgi:hypothetical protein